MLTLPSNAEPWTISAFTVSILCWSQHTLKYV